MPPTAEGIPELPLAAYLSGLRRFTGEEYDRLTEIGFFKPDDRIELLDGFLVKKMSHNPAHDGSLYALDDLVVALSIKGWVRRVQMVLMLPGSRPEPDLVLARGDRSTYFSRHPGVDDLGLVVEVSDASLAIDKKDKLRIYAACGVPLVWIVNVPKRVVEVYSNPQLGTSSPSYSTQTDYPVGSSVPLQLDQKSYSIPVADFLPPL
jgi:Uma2 family endonuclease